MWCNSMQINVSLIDRSVSLCLIIITFFMLKHIKNCRSQGSRIYFTDVIKHGPDCQRANYYELSAL